MNNSISVILLGEATCGKTSIVNRIVKNTFKENTEATVGAAFYTHTFDKYKFNFWDTAGQERYLSLTPLYYRKGEVVILVFDASRLSSIDRVIYYLEKIKEELTHKFEVIIVGTKTDLTQHSIEYIDALVKEQLKEFEDNGIIKDTDYIYISSKTTTNCDKLLKLIIEKGKIIYDSKMGTVTNDDEVVSIDNKSSFLSKLTFGYCV